MLLSIWGHLFPLLGLRWGTTAIDMSGEKKCLPVFSFDATAAEPGSTLFLESRKHFHIQKAMKKKKKSSFFIYEGAVLL